MSAKGRAVVVWCVAFALFALVAPGSAPAGTLTIAPTADGFVRALTPGANFGTADFLDSHGGFGSHSCGSDGLQSGAAYAYLKFDLAAIPPDAVIESAEIRLTSRTGFAWDGDPYQHLRFVADDSWTERGLTYANSPANVDAGDLASQFIFYDFPVCGDPKGAPRPQAFADAALTRKVTAERSGDGTISLQVFNPNCSQCPGGNRGYWVRFFSREALDPDVRPRLVVTYSTLAVYDAVPDPATGSTTVVGRVTASPSKSFTLRFYSSPTCEDGRLGEQRSLLGTATEVTTDEAGDAYFARKVLSVAPPGSFVAATAEAPEGAPSPLSRCVPAPDNDAWPRARELTLTESGDSAARAAEVSQSLDLDGQARWYRFDVQPDSKVTLDLTGLPANYDLFVFKDLAKALTPVSADEDLLRLSAEVAGATTAPSAFSPSAFSPSAFSPSAFSPSAFSPSAFSPSAFSPSAFSPSAFSPSAFSPSAFSPSAFSPSAFSPSAFSPEAYSSAQVRSLIGASTSEGTAAESITLNSWGNTRLYVRVNGRLGASKVASPFRLRVTADAGTCTGVAPLGSAPADAPAQGRKTVILTDLPRMGGTAAEKDATLSRLRALAARPEVAGAIVDLSQDARIVALNAQADAHSACPYAKNLVAGASKDIVDSFRANNPGLAYVVVVGTDTAVPFFRYPDTAGLGPESEYVPPVLDTSASQASLRRNYVLSQDAYGARTEVSLGASSVPVPDLAVGRLAEAPSAISTVLDAYLQTAAGVAPTPKSSLVTGYDFLTDAAHAVQDEFSAGLGSGAGVRKETLITDANVPAADVGEPPTRSWDADRLRARLLGSRHDLMFLAGHFSANNALAADYETTLNASELAASPVDLTNAIVASAGCHSGYNIVDGDAIAGVTVPLDWVEAFARKGATLIGGTGYQYGDTDFLEYSERLYAGFARQLRMGIGAVPVGRAIVQAKQDYLAGTPIMRGIHAKALLEATLYGLPMLSVDLPAGRIPVPATTSIVGATKGFGEPSPGAALGLRYADVTLTPTTTTFTKTLTNLEGGTTTASWLRGPDGVLTNPGEAALPLARYDVSVAGRVLRGVGLRSATFDSPEPAGITPLTGAPTTEQQAVHTPFAPSVFFPLRLWSINYFGALAAPGGATTLAVTPAQHKADGPASLTTIRRRYSGLDLRLYYSNEKAAYPTGPNSPPNTPALAAPPTITAVQDRLDGPDLSFKIKIVGDPSAGIQEVWITYSGVHPGRWESLELQQSAADSALWTGSLRLPAGVSAPAVRYIVQAVNGVGLTSLDDNFGAYYSATGADSGPPAPPQRTSLRLVSAAANGTYRSSAKVSADLIDADGFPLAGKVVSFAIGGSARTAITDAGGRASASVPLTDLPGSYRLTAAFGGDVANAGASDALGAFSISRLPATLALSPSDSQLTRLDPGPVATLTADGAPLPARAVLFVLRGADGSVAARLARVTDGKGRARIETVDVPAGDYAVAAYFGGTIPLATGQITLGDPTPYSTATASGTIRVSVPNLPDEHDDTVPPTLALSVGATASFGAFRPGVDRSYEASTTANVVSTVGGATVSVTDPSTTATGRLVNGSFAVREPLQASLNSGAFAPLSATAGSPLALRTYTGPVRDDAVTIRFRQHIRSDEVLRTGAYSKTLRFTLSTTTP